MDDVFEGVRKRTPSQIKVDTMLIFGRATTMTFNTVKTRGTATRLVILGLAILFGIPNLPFGGAKTDKIYRPRRGSDKVIGD